MRHTFEVVAHAPDGGSETFHKSAEGATRGDARDVIIERCERIDAQFPGAWSEVSR